MWYLIARNGVVPRFDTIVFVDLPQAGARKEIFDLHLAKYFPAFRNAAHSPFGDREWRRLLKATHLCTPAEIDQIVRKAAQEAFYLGRPGHCTLDDLLYQRSLMVPAMIREEEAILAIRNRASFAHWLLHQIPANGQCRSNVSSSSMIRLPPGEVFHQLRTATKIKGVRLRNDKGTPSRFIYQQAMPPTLAPSYDCSSG